MASASDDVGRVWITGSTRGIGLATARMLAGRGYDVVIHGRDQQDAERVCRELRQSHSVRAIPVAFDISDRSGAPEAARRIKAELGGLDAFVGNAGIHSAALLGMIGDDDIDRLLATNVAGLLRSVQNATKLMRHSGGSVVLLSSVMGTRGGAGQVLYSASKAAVVGLMRAAAKELGPQGIRVNVVAPGFVETDMTADLDDVARTRRVESTPLRRLGTVDDVAELICFFVSGRSSFITGQLVGVDGGLEP